MALETGTFISDLVVTNPTGSDALAFADDHLRLIKSTVKATFPNISGAVTKTHTEINNTLDKTGDTMTGALTLAGAPTADLHAATKAYIDAAIVAARQNAYPVGSIYINAASVTNPATLLGFGTWVEFGSGRVMVGQNTGDASFDVLEETGGSKDAIVVSHGHTFSGTASTASLVGTFTASKPPEASGIVTYQYGISGGADGAQTSASRYTIDASHSHTVSGTVSNTGSSGTNANLQPYVVVKMWKRTA
jgi:hypothetical protein